LSLDLFTKALAEIGDESKPLVSSKLAKLSNISQQEMLLFLEVWGKMGFEKRRRIAGQLVELAEDDPFLNFDDIFCACLRDPDEIVRVRAIEGLWENENHSLIVPFITMLREDGFESVRAAAAQALGKFAMLAELGKLRQDDEANVEEALVAVIEDQGEKLEVRCRAVEAIAPLNRPRVTRIIKDAYQSGDDRMQVSAINAMGMNSDPAWLPTLLKEMENPDAEMRFEAAGACGDLGDEDAVPQLVRLIRDPENQVQLAAIAALGKIGGSEAEATIRECLNHPDEHISGAADDTLEELEVGKDPFSFRIM
jgi:HEAT repeat protein